MESRLIFLHRLESERQGDAAVERACRLKVAGGPQGSDREASVELDLLKRRPRKAMV